MKLYRTPEGVFFGRRGDAGKTAAIVEVQTDANSLAAFANQLVEESVARDLDNDEYTTVVERQDPPVETTAPASTLVFDDAWEALPIAAKAHFASLFCEEARTMLGRTGEPKASQSWGSKTAATEDVDPFA